MRVISGDTILTATGVESYANGGVYAIVPEQSLCISFSWLGAKTGPIEILPNEHPVSQRIDMLTEYAEQAGTNGERRRAEAALKQLAQHELMARAA